MMTGALGQKLRIGLHAVEHLALDLLPVKMKIGGRRRQQGHDAQHSQGTHEPAARPPRTLRRCLHSPE